MADDPMGNIKIDSGIRINIDMLDPTAPENALSLMALLRESLHVVTEERTDAQREGTTGTAVGDSKPGISPIKLQERKEPRAIRNGV